MEKGQILTNLGDERNRPGLHNLCRTDTCFAVLKYQIKPRLLTHKNSK